MTSFHLGAIVVGAVACVIDLRTARIPNALTFPAAAIGVLAHAAAPDGHGFLFAVVGLLAGLAVFFPFFALGGLGAGDVKLMAALGAWLGWVAICWVAIYGAVAGGALAVVVGLWHGYLRTAFSNVATLLQHWWLVGVRPLPAATLEHGRGPRLAYGLPIFIGLVVTLWLR